MVNKCKELPNKEWLLSEVKRLHEARKTKKFIKNQLGISEYRLNLLSVELGIANLWAKHRPWNNKQELELLEVNASKSIIAIKSILMREGFYRTYWAILHQLERMELFNEYNRPNYARSVASALGVSHVKVDRWIAKSMLKAKKEYGGRSTRKNNDVPPTYWEILDKDLGNFLVNFPLEWEMRKVPRLSQPWVIDLIRMAIKKHDFE